MCGTTLCGTTLFTVSELLTTDQRICDKLKLINVLISHLYLIKTAKLAELYEVHRINIKLAELYVVHRIITW